MMNMSIEENTVLQMTVSRTPWPCGCTRRWSRRLWRPR